MTWQQIARLFEEMELRLIASLTRNLAGHKEWEKNENFHWPAWQALKIRNLEQYRRQNKALMKEYRPVIDEATEQMLREQFDEGWEQTQQELIEIDPERAKQSIPDDHFFGVNQRRLNSLIDEIQTAESRVERAALRTMEDAYRQTISRVELSMSAGAVTLPQAIDMAVKDFLAQGIRCVEYKNGRRVNIADYAQMALRTAATRSMLLGEAQRRAELGVDTVLVSQYGACSETCLSWQGKVYIDDVWGVWDGERSGDRGLSNDDHWYMLLSVAVNKGLFHPNCRHTLLTWRYGDPIPPPMDGDKIRKTAALEQQQRGLEREVRKWKRMAEGTIDEDQKKAYQRKVREAQKNVREFVKGHEDVLRRDYWREKTYGVPEVDKSEKSDIMSRGQDKDVEPIRRLGNIQTEYLEKEFGHIRTPEIIITDEREKHIRERHPEDYALFKDFGIEAVTNPDVVLRDMKNAGTVFMIRRLERSNLNVVVRVVLETDNPEYKNSIMTFYRLRERNLEKLIEKNKLLYNKGEML